MDREEILAILKETIGTVKPKLDTSVINENSLLTNDLGIDSLSMLLLSLAVEQRFNFQFDSRQVFLTVGQVIDCIEQNAK